MRPFPQQYSELPVEEKLEDGQPEAPANNSKWSKRATLWVLSMLAFASLLLVIGTGALSGRTPVYESPVEESDWLAHATRAAGDQYLLGVGKADITGYVNCPPQQPIDTDSDLIDLSLS
jgi:neutral ceramidase